MSTGTSKPRCGRCLTKGARGARFCVKCGGSLGMAAKAAGALGRAFYDETDPTVRELLWKAAHGGLNKGGV